jgi:hypothetical protein
MRFRILAAVTVAASLAAVAPVLTVTNGQPDGNLHPFVGTVIQFIPGTDLISGLLGLGALPTKFLTAAHCADPTCRCSSPTSRASVLARH